jgi:hypothetical protein
VTGISSPLLPGWMPREHADAVYEYHIKDIAPPIGQAGPLTRVVAVQRSRTESAGDFCLTPTQLFLGLGLSRLVYEWSFEKGEAFQAPEGGESHRN